MSEELLVLGAGLLVLVLGFAVAQFRKVRREQVIGFVTRYTPDQFDMLLANVAGRAYDAVEQLASAYEAMSSEEKQALAIKIIRQLLGAAGFAISKVAAKGLLESYISRTVEGKPLAERS